MTTKFSTLKYLNLVSSSTEIHQLLKLLQSTAVLNLVRVVVVTDWSSNYHYFNLKYPLVPGINTGTVDTYLVGTRVPSYMYEYTLGSGDPDIAVRILSKMCTYSCS